MSHTRHQLAERIVVAVLDELSSDDAPSTWCSAAEREQLVLTVIDELAEAKYLQEPDDTSTEATSV